MLAKYIYSHTVLSCTAFCEKTNGLLLNEKSEDDVFEKASSLQKISVCSRIQYLCILFLRYCN